MKNNSSDSSNLLQSTTFSVSNLSRFIPPTITDLANFVNTIMQNNPAVKQLTSLAELDPVIGNIRGQDVKISGLWSGSSEKKQRDEEVMTEYKGSFQLLYEGSIDTTEFVESLQGMKPAETNLQELFDPLQSFSAWKADKKAVGKNTTVSLEPVQDQETY